MMRHLLLVLIITSFSFSVCAQKEAPVAEADTAYLMKIVKKLASEEYAGRLSGSAEYNMAANYVGQEFKKLKIKPIEGSSYFQYLEVEYNDIVAPLIFQRIFKDGSYKTYKAGPDYVCRGFTGSNTHTAEVVFCGYGISLPKHGYDDYAGKNVNGKVVMIFKENPQWENIIGWPSDLPRYKAMVAAQYGAMGILLVSAPNNGRSKNPIGSVATGTMKQHNYETTSMHISHQVANELLEPQHYTIEQLQAIIDSTHKPFSFNTGSKVQTEIHANYTPNKPVMNVIGLIEGNDPILKNEFLVIGAHLDHVGRQGDSLFFPGANDNASGVASVLQIAQLLSKNKDKLKRSVVFILFANEEQGLVGSWHYVKNPLIPISQTVAMFNLDCVGHGDSIQIGNGKSSPVLWNLCHNIDSLSDNLMVNSTWSGGGADATPFYDKNIPALYFVTTNSYTHLHQHTDTPETLNKELHQKITTLAFKTALEVLTGNYSKEKVIR